MSTKRQKTSFDPLERSTESEIDTENFDIQEIFSVTKELRAGV